MIRRRQGGTWIDPGTFKRRQGGAWVVCQNVYRRQGGGWVLIWHYNVSGTVSPAQATGSLVATGPSGQVQTYAVTATGSGGSGAYTYAWSIATVSSGNPPTISNPNSASTSFSRNVTQGIGEVTGIAQVRITDANGSSSVVVNVPYSLSYSTRQ